RGDLVAHERDEGRYEERRPGSGVAQQLRRDEVDGRLAPARALHDERAAAGSDERLDRLELAVVEGRVVAPHELSEGDECGVVQAAGGHGSTLSAWSDIRMVGSGGPGILEVMAASPETKIDAKKEGRAIRLGSLDEAFQR